MGLDNGIVIRHREGKPIYIPKRYYNNKYCVGDNLHYEVAYWRKCWGIRNAIIDTVLPEPDTYDSYDIVLDEFDMKAIIKELKKFTKEAYWDRYADSIWEYKEFVNNQRKIIRNLKFVYWYMKFDPQVHVYFYDSY